MAAGPRCSTYMSRIELRSLAQRLLSESGDGDADDVGDAQ